MANKDKKDARDKAAESIYQRSGLIELRFKFKKTKGISRTEGKFKESIYFGTMRSPNTLPGVNIFTVDAQVYDHEYEKFQGEVLKMQHFSGRIGGGTIGNLFTPPPPYIRYDLGDDAAMQENIVSEVVKVIQTQALPFFEICRAPEKIAENILLPGFHFPSFIRYFHYLKREDLLNEILRKKMDRQKEFQHYLKYFYDKIKAEGQPELGFPETFGNEMKSTASRTAALLLESGIENEFVK